jgi:cation/acetate symporter
MATHSQSAFYSQLKRYYSIYTGGFIAFVIVLAIAEQMGVPNRWIGYGFKLFDSFARRFLERCDQHAR